MAPGPAPPPDENNQTFASPSPDSGASMNGPSAAAPPEGDKIWERSWSVDEIRKGSTNWSLAGDAGLLLHLQQFSQKMVSRTHEIEKQVDELVHDTKVAHVRVHNVFNDFIMLANTQFVENRVYDEDVSQESKEETKKDEPEKSREQRENELIPKIAEAIGFGLRVIENSFEELDVNVGDSESEDDDDNVGRPDKILKVKDVYAHRPLPHLIGSPAFMQEDDVGIVEEYTDEDDLEEESDHGSISDSEGSEKSESETESSYSETESETDSETEKPKKRARSKVSEDEGSEEGDLFGTKDSEEGSDMESEEEQVIKQKPMGGIAAELAAKIGAPPPMPHDDDDDSSDDEPKQKQKEHKHKKKRADSGTSKASHHRKRSDSERSKGKSVKKAVKEEDPFGGPSIEEDSPFGNKGGLFSGGGGLFDEDDDGGGLFGSVPKPKEVSKPAPQVVEEEEEEEEEKPVEKAKTKSGKNIPSGGVSIFGGGDDELFMPSPSDESAPKQKTSAPGKSFGGGLFDDGDDDLFSSAPKKAPTKKVATKPQTKPAVDLFGGDDDDEGDLFASMASAKKPESTKAVEKEKGGKKKLPAGAVSAFGAGPNPLAAAIMSQRQHSDEEDDGGWSDGDKSTSSSLSSARQETKTDRSPSASSNSLFAEEPEEQKSEKKSSKPAAKVSAGLFAEDDEADDLFSALPKAKPEAKPAGKPRSGSLFVEDDEGDLFGSASPVQAVPAKKKPVGGVSLFGGADIFGDSSKKAKEPEEKKPSPPPAEPTPQPAKTKAAVKNTPLSLFDDDDDDSGKLFGQAAPAKPKAEDDKRKRTKSKSLFDDEDVLFGSTPATAEENPTIDLFGANSPLTPSEPKAKPFPTEEPKAAPAVKISGTTTKSSSTDLFGGDETDDLFSAPPKKSEPPKKPMPVEGKLPLSDATEDDSSTDVFAAPTKPAPAATKPRKPVGGVSMFGGMDPFAAKKPASSPTEEKVEAKKPPADPLFGGDKDDLFSKSVEKTPEPVNNVDTQRSTVSPSKMKSGMAAGLTINPQALLPGAAPPVKEPEEKGVSFDEPADAKTLHCVTKGRAKIQQKRRLPSRARGRPGATTTNGPIDEFDALTSSSGRTSAGNSVSATSAPRLPDITPPPDMRASLPDITSPPEVKATPPAGKPRDLFGNDDLFQSEAGKSDPLFSFGAEPAITKNVSRDDDIFKSEDRSKKSAPPLSLDDEDDIFNSGKKSVKSNSGDIFGAKSSAPDDDDDIFPSGPKKNKVPSDLDLFAPKTYQNNDTNDIFGSAKMEEKKDSKPAPSSFISPATDDEDIFASKSTNVTKPKPKLVKEDDNDIFADTSVTKKKESLPAATAMDDDDADIFAAKAKSTTKKEEKKDIFEDDDELFASPSKKVTKLKKEKTKDEALFKDDTDIFASLPASKPKEKKKKKTDTGSKSLFKGDVDDIFASPPKSSPTTKAKSKKASSTKKKTTTKDGASIFDENAPSIFDDPLNAMQS